MINNMILQNSQPFILQEKFNLQLALKLLQSDIIDDETKGSLKKYLKYSKNQKVEVLYTPPPDGIGRLSIRINNIKIDKDNVPKDTCRAQYNLRKIVKASLCDKFYVDLDVCNCHPIILLQVFQKSHLNCQTLEIFVNTRDKIFSDFQIQGINKDKCKELFMCVFYGGSIGNWCFKNSFEKNNIPKLFYDLEKEIIDGRNVLLEKDYMSKYIAKANEKKGENGFNLQGTTLSYFIQTIECKILMGMYNWLTSHNYLVGALIHDGLHLQKVADDKEYEMIIYKLEKHISDITQFDIKLKIKPFEVPKQIDEIIIIENDEEGGIILSDMLKNSYIECDNREFYKKDNVWISDEKTIKKEIKKFIYSQNIFIQRSESLEHYSKMTKGLNNIFAFVTARKDKDFINKLFESNLGKLCFENGYWDFAEKKLKQYDNNCHTCVKINKEYKPSSNELKKEVMERIFNPIFANDTEMMNSWLNTFSRALAGHIEDKNWVVNMGERNCGKSVIVGMLECAFGGYVRTTNGENFIFKNTIGESSKALSWLVPFEFKRIITTNEITRDGENKYKINGNILKKLASGGDMMEARVNHKDEINFKIQARPFIFCNDLPPIEPSDAKETSYIYNFPSKFVDPNDTRLGQTILDDNKNVLCSFQKKDDNIKQWSRQPEVIQAFTDIIFDHYDDMLPLPKRIADDCKDFSDTGNEYQVLDDLFSYVGHTITEWDGSEYIEKKVTLEQYETAKRIKYVIEKKQINMSAQKYNKYFTTKGCVRKVKKVNGKATNVVEGIKFIGEEE
jgi:hypothetical protein